MRIKVLSMIITLVMVSMFGNPIIFAKQTPTEELKTYNGCCQKS